MELKSYMRYRSECGLAVKEPELVASLGTQGITSEIERLAVFGISPTGITDLPPLTLENGDLEHKIEITWEGEPAAFHKAQFAGLIPIQPQKCLRCDHEWQPRIKKMPVLCPKCKSPYWSRPRKSC